jgi:hypothetical protein
LRFGPLFGGIARFGHAEKIQNPEAATPAKTRNSPRATLSLEGHGHERLVEGDKVAHAAVALDVRDKSR